MEATTIPITALSPSNAPPASKSIRAVVSLLWPYSSSTKQCALLLADPDFRLRNRKGQVRVRFTGPSAEAVAKGRIGIGDELLLELGGAQWASEQARVATPGKSVDGELLYAGQLTLSVVKKANGEEGDVRVQVHESTPPPEQSDKPISNGNHATPARAAPSWMRSSMGGADVTPIYSSPAFVKRLRLSEEHSSFDPFADVEKELEDDAGPRKRQRISFGGVKRWKLTERTPSPEKQDTMAMQVDAGEGLADTEGDVRPEESEEHDPPTIDSSPPGTRQPPAQTSGFPTMPPPPLPRLQLPSDSRFLEMQQNQQTRNVEDDGPSTPKLHPVPSSALPLPSPFPTEASKVQFGSPFIPATSTSTALDALVEAADAARSADVQQPSDPQSAAESPKANNDDLEAAVLESPVTQTQRRDASPSESLASTAEIVRDEDSFERHPNIDTTNAGPPMSTNVQNHDQTQHSVPEYFSDTEEDEEMYYDHMRRRFPSVTESGRVRVDHQEEGYYDDLSEIDEDDADEVIDADDMGEEPQSGESDEDEDEEDVDDEEGNTDVVLEIPETLPNPVASLKQTDKGGSVETTAPPAEDAETSRLEKVLEEASTEAREEVRKEPQKPLKTPAQPPARLFGFDGPANDTPVQPQSTPRSEKDRIMAKTFSSLFGFRASPSPDMPRHQQLQTPTPAMPASQSFQSVKEKLEAASASVDDASTIKGDQEMHVAPRGDQNVAGDSSVHVPPATEEETDNIPSSGAAVEEAAQAVEETGDSLPVSDIQDGSLLSAVNADEKEKNRTDRNDVSETTETTNNAKPTAPQDESRVVDESPNLDVEMHDVHDDPVPDGVSINRELGEAIAPKLDDEPPQPPPSSAPGPTQVTVVDLGDSSDDEEQPGQSTQQASGQAEEDASMTEPDVGSSARFAQESMPAPDQYAQAPPAQVASRHVTQDSQGSILQSDMLDTTQTTVDRSEIATPVAEEYDTIIADTFQDDVQDGFFAEQVQNQDFQGIAMPQLTQQPTGAITDPYHYFSFQSATSVATDNSDNLPPTVAQSFAEEEQQIESAPFALAEQVAQEGFPPAVSQHEDAMILDPALSMPGVVDRPQIEDAPQDDVAMAVNDGSATEFKSLQSTEHASSPMEVDSTQVRSFSQQAQGPETAQINSSLERRLSEEIAMENEMAPVKVQVTEAVAESEMLVDSQDLAEQIVQPYAQASHPALPISPVESQHTLESQAFETQIRYPAVSNELPPTPQLTQGESRAKDELQVVVENADQMVESQEPATPPPPRTRRSQRAAGENLESRAKKNSVTRSPRKTHEDAQKPAEPSEELSHADKDAKANSSQRRRRSVQLDTNSNLLNPSQKTPVRRSPRKSQAPTEALGEVAERREGEESEGIASQLSPQQSSFELISKTAVRRSARKSQAQSQTSERASEDMEVTTPAKRSARQSTKKAQTPHMNGDGATDDTVKEPEDADDTISVTPPVKPTTRQSAKKAQVQMEHDEDKEMTDSQLAVPPKTPTTSKKSFTSQIGRVPAAIADWFSPRRSSRQEREKEEASAVSDKPPTIERQKSSGFATSLSYFLPLSNLEEKVNPASQYQTDNTVDVLAVVTDETKAPERAKSGPRDYFTIFRVTDFSLTANESNRVEVFRPWHSVLPKAQVGDVVLLRAFAVKTRKRKPYLISTDASAWCVWRFAETEGESTSADKHVPVTRKRGASFSATCGAREEVKGPPVEFGEEERGRVAELRKWWTSQKGVVGGEEDANKAVSSRTARMTRSQKL